METIQTYKNQTINNYDILDYHNCLKGVFNVRRCKDGGNLSYNNLMIF